MLGDFPDCEMNAHENHKYRDGAPVRSESIVKGREPEQCGQCHCGGSCEDHCHNARADAGQKGFDTRVFHEIFQHGGDEQDDYKCWNCDAQRCKKRTCKSRL